MQKLDKEKSKDLESFLKLIDEKTPNERGEMLRDVESMHISDDYKQVVFIIVDTYSSLSASQKKHLLYCVQKGEWIPAFAIPSDLREAMGF